MTLCKKHLETLLSPLKVHTIKHTHNHGINEYGPSQPARQSPNMPTSIYKLYQKPLVCARKSSIIQWVIICMVSPYVSHNLMESFPGLAHTLAQGAKVKAAFFNEIPRTTSYHLTMDMKYLVGG